MNKENQVVNKKEVLSAITLSDIEVKNAYDRDDSDVLDVPFRIKGFSLRWVSAYKTESRKDGLWKPLKKSALPPKVLELLEENFYALFSDGDVIRNKELTLCYAPSSLTKQIRERRLDKSKQSLQRVVQVSPQDANKIQIVEKETGWESGQEFFRS